MSNNLYIRQLGTVQVSTDNSIWSTISWPYTVTNPTPPTILKVLFTTDITLTANDQYFICGSNNIQFGSESLNPDGTRPTITITSGANSYPGLINNGNEAVNVGKDNISVYNLIVDGSGATLSNFGGWIGQNGFSYGANNNYIIGCSSKGDISELSGGIIGSASGVNGNLNIIGCDSSGDINNNGGGISGVSFSGISGIYQCFSKGNIIGSNAGGIVGSGAQNITISNCYSIGNISGNGAGGISGGDTLNIQVSNSYSRGIISNPNAGGIIGQESIYCTATNCYSSGNISDGGGIFGANGFGNTETNCYVASGNWTDSAAASVLQNIGWSSGSIWGSLSANTPYLLVGFGASPYTLNNINPATNTLVQTFSQSVQAGNTTLGALAAGYKTFEIKEGGDPTITIDNTGVITTTSETPAGTYTLSIYGVDDYTTTTYILTVTAAPTPPAPIGGAGAETTIPPCCEANTCNKNPQRSSYSSETIALNRAGKAINTSVTNFYNDVAAGLRPPRYKPVFKSYYDYMQFLQGKSR